MLTRLVLKSDVEDTSNTFIYKGKWTPDIAFAFSVYNKQLPSVLLVDSRGFIRWHAIGLPNDKCIATLRPLVKQLLREKSVSM